MEGCGLPLLSASPLRRRCLLSPSRSSPLLLMQLYLISLQKESSRLWGHFQDQTVQKGQAQHIEKELLLPVKQGIRRDMKGTKQRAVWRFLPWLSPQAKEDPSNFCPRLSVASVLEPAPQLETGNCWVGKPADQGTLEWHVLMASSPSPC